MEINFKCEQNTAVWNAYKAAKQAEGAGPASLLQYKEASLQLERSCNGESFNTLTVSRLNHAKTNKPKKHSHINGFLIDMVNAGMIVLPIDVKMELIPTNYRQFVAGIVNK